MPYAANGNREVKITEAEIQHYIDLGCKVYDENGMAIDMVAIPESKSQVVEQPEEIDGVTTSKKPSTRRTKTKTE